MTFVVDSSVVASWCLGDETVQAAHAALDRLESEDALAPSLLWFEVRNALIVAERRRRQTPAATDAFLLDLESLPILLESRPPEATVVELARLYDLSVYDAAYLELALRHAAPLATLDRPLARAAADAGVTLVGA